MGSPTLYQCKNIENKCPRALDFEKIEIVPGARAICPSCKGDLEPVRAPLPLWLRVLRKVAIVGTPLLLVALVVFWHVSKPPPPLAVKVLSATPPGTQLGMGETKSWTLLIDGGRTEDKPEVSVDSLSLFLVSKSDLRVEKTDGTNRKFKLTARPIAGQTGRGEIKVSAGIGKNVAATNLAFEVVRLGPPTLALQTTVSLILESGRDSLALPFTVSDGKTESEKLTFSATVDPSDKVLFKTQDNGSSRKVILSRNQRESGLVKLSVRLVTPDGRETNQTYSVTVIPSPPPPLTIAVNFASPPGGPVRPGEGVTWEFTLGGGDSSEKPVVSAESLSPAVLPQAGVQLETADDTGRKYRLTARPITGPGGKAELKIIVRAGGEVKVATNLTFQVAPLGPPILALQSPQSLVLDSDRDKLLLLFTLSDEKAEAEKLVFSATVEPAERVGRNIEGSGDTRIVTLSRNQRESGPVKLSVRLASPDGRETNQIYNVTVVPPIDPSPVPPPVAIVRELLKKARAAWIERRYQEAIGICDDALARDPRSAEAWTTKGGVYYSWLRYADAVAACDAALAINPKFADAWFTKASSEQTSDNPQGALSSYRKFLETVQTPDPRVPVVEERVRKLEAR